MEGQQPGKISYKSTINGYKLDKNDHKSSNFKQTDWSGRLNMLKKYILQWWGQSLEQSSWLNKKLQIFMGSEKGDKVICEKFTFLN